MHVAIAGAGPTGLVLGAALVRRGHDVTVVDRDPGPAPDGSWQRRGVMQFELAHAFRAQVRSLLVTEWPEAYAEWERLGAEPTTPAGPGAPIGNRSRHVHGPVEDGCRVRGLVVGGCDLAADLVVDATGRSGRVFPRIGTVGGECGMAYVDRVHRLRPGAEPGPLVNGVALVGSHDGYLTLVFLHERGFFSVLFVRPTADAALQGLRHTASFEAACAAVPGLSAWTDPERSRPVSEVLSGAGLRNEYHPQLGRPGLVAVGDAVATTTPTAGRGVAMCAMQVQALLALLDDGADPATVAGPFGAWCDHHMLPWVEDHIACDDEMVLRWQGVPLDPEASLTSTSIVDAAQQEPRIMGGAGPYFAMDSLPSSLHRFEGLAREVYRTGWRPAYAEGPSRDELVAIVQGAMTPT